MKSLTCFVIIPSNRDNKNAVKLLSDQKHGLVEFPTGCKEATAPEDIVELDFLTVFDQIIKPAVDKVNNEFEKQKIQIDCIRAQDLPEAGDIIGQIIRYICTADITITDITTNNPNVFLEFGIRLVVKDELNIMICHERVHHLPFDVQKLRCIYYDTDIKKANQARDEIAKYIRNFMQKRLPKLTNQKIELPGYSSDYSSFYKQFVELYTGKLLERELISTWTRAQKLLINLTSFFFTQKKIPELEFQLFDFLDIIANVLKRDPKGKTRAVEFYELMSNIKGIPNRELMKIYFNLAELCDEYPNLKEKAEMYRNLIVDLEE